MMQCVTYTVLIVLCGLLSFSHAKDNQCPGDKASCPYDSTCCVHNNGSFGCCPSQNAVCCGDSVHCCPNGYTCDVAAGKCKKRAEHNNVIENIPAIKTSIAGECIKGFETKALLQKTSALVIKISAALQSLRPNFLYHDGRKCESWETRCWAGYGRFTCCPVSHGVCCDHGKFCCPATYHCDIPRHYCLRQI